MNIVAKRVLRIFFGIVVYWNIGLLYWHMMNVYVVGQEIVTPWQHFLAGGWDWTKGVNQQHYILSILTWAIVVLICLISWVIYGCVWLVGSLSVAGIAAWKFLFGGGLAEAVIAHSALWILVLALATMWVLYLYSKRLNSARVELPRDADNKIKSGEWF